MQQLFHGLGHAKKLNILSVTKVNGIRETKTEKIYATKKKLTLMKQTKRNEIRCFLVRETSEILQMSFLFGFVLCFAEQKKDAQLKPYFLVEAWRCG
jgi:hypothetical protein